MGSPRRWQVILGISSMLFLARPTRAGSPVECNDSALNVLESRVKTTWPKSEWECQSDLQSAANNPSPATAARAGKSCQDAAAIKASLAASYLQLVVACGQAGEPQKGRLAGIGKSLNQMPTFVSGATLFKNLQSLRLNMSLDRMPASRVKVNLDETKTGRHLEAEWDPSQSSPLFQLLTLPPGSWQSSLWIEPLVTTGAISSAVRLPGLSIPANEMTFNDASGSPISVTIELAKLPKLRDVHKSLQQGSLAESGTRGIESTVPAAAQEIFRIFAEIAYERTRSKAFELLSQILARFICNDLKLPGDLAQELGLPNRERQLLPETCSVVKNLRVQELASSAQSLLRSLFTDVSQLSTDALVAQLSRAANSSQPAELSAAVPSRESGSAPEELVRKIGPEAQTPYGYAKLMAKTMGPVFRKSLPLLVDAASGRRQLTTRDATLILMQLVQVNWLEELGADQTDPTTEASYVVVGCGMQLGFAVIADCLHKGGCDAREIAERVARPADFYDLSADPDNQVSISCATYLTKEGAGQPLLRDYFPDLEQFVAHGLEVIYPEKGVAARTTVRNAVDFSFAIAERLRCARPVVEKSHTNDACPEPGHLGDLLKNLRLITVGLIDRDVVPTMLGITELLKLPLDRLSEKEGGWQESHKRLNLALVKANQVLTALGSYAATYGNPGDPSSANAQHAARKKAIESLIDATTRRTNRDGEWVASIGASVGFYGGMQWIRSKSDCYRDAGPCAMVPQLSLPMGVALQYLPDRRNAADKQNPARARSVSVGWHTQLSPIDLGQFIALDGSAQLTESVHWADFVTAGLQTGIIIGTPDVNFLLAADFRWLPTAFSSPDSGNIGAFRLGLTLSYYVSFFDFN